jgi:multiple sugar transport system permease protein
LPLTIWILTTFFRELPRELEESAKVDGSGLIGTFFRLVLPLSAPGVFTAAILAFISAWNEYLFAVSFTTNDSVRPVTVGLANFSGGASFYVPWGEIAAGAVVVTVPLIILVLILQRRIVAGLTAGAVKG